MIKGAGCQFLSPGMQEITGEARYSSCALKRKHIYKKARNHVKRSTPLPSPLISAPLAPIPSAKHPASPHPINQKLQYTVF